MSFFKQNKHMMYKRYATLMCRHLGCHSFELRGDVGRQALWCLRYALALSFFFLSLLAVGSGCRAVKKAREMKANGQVSPNSPPSLAFISPQCADTPPWPNPPHSMR